MSVQVVGSTPTRVPTSVGLTVGALAVFASTWIVSGLMLLIAGRQQQGTAQFISDDPWNYYVFRPLPADPGFFGVIMNWDGQWHQRIATLGYLPVDDAQGFADRAWQFPPVYPLTVRLLTELLPVGVPTAAWIVSSLFAALAMVVLAHLTRPRLGTFGALALVAVTGCYITAPLLQAAYSESMALFFFLWTIWELDKRHYATALLPLLIMSFTRLITPPLAAVAAVHLMVRLRSGQRVSTGDRVLLVGYAMLALTGPFLWSLVAGLIQKSAVTSRAGAAMGAEHVGWFGILWSISPWSVVVPVVLAIWFVRLAWSERGRLGAELATWAGAYPIFVLAVTPPTPGFLRYFMFAFPFGVAAVGMSDTEPRRRVVGVLIVCLGMLVLQYLWVRYSFVVDPDPGRPVLNP